MPRQADASDYPALVIPDESYADLRDVERRVQQVFSYPQVYEADDEEVINGLKQVGDEVDQEELHRGDVQRFLKSCKTRIDGALRKINVVVNDSEEHEEARDLLRAVNADCAAERAFPPYLTDSDLNRNRVTSKWREDLKAIVGGDVDLDVDEGDEFLGFTGGQSYKG